MQPAPSDFSDTFRACSLRPLSTIRIERARPLFKFSHSSSISQTPVLYGLSVRIEAYHFDNPGRTWLTEFSDGKHLVPMYTVLVVNGIISP